MSHQLIRRQAPLHHRRRRNNNHPSSTTENTNRMPPAPGTPPRTPNRPRGLVATAATSERNSPDASQAQAQAQGPSPSTAPEPRSLVTPRINVPPAQVPCKFFKAGYCTRGETCWFKHEEPVRPDTHNTNTTVDAPAGRGTSSSSAPTNEEPCAICFDKPETYGLMTGCDHVFCLACIRQWRSSSSNMSAPADPYEDSNALANTSKTCPLCRVRTRYIIPSVVFPHDASQKKELERVYLYRLSRIPCRYFTASLQPRESPRDATGRKLPHGRRDAAPWCPFGNDCHYLHEKDPGVKYTFSDAELNRAMWGQRSAVRHQHSRYGRGAVARRLGIFGAGGMSDWVFRVTESHYAHENSSDVESDDYHDIDEMIAYDFEMDEILASW